MQGRFTSPDEFTGGPVELYYFVDDAAANPTFYADLTNPQSLNKYQYTYNNPLRYVDPTGHCPECAAVAPVTRVIISVPFIPLPVKIVVVGVIYGAALGANQVPVVSDPSCQGCASSHRMGQALMENSNQNNSGNQGQQQGQGSSNAQSTGQNTPQSSKHDQEKKQEGRSGQDPKRDVGDANRVKREGKKYLDTDTGNFVYVSKKGHTVITNPSGEKIVSRNTYTKKQVQARVNDGRWESQ